MGDVLPDHEAKLRRVLSAFPGQGFAVLDGARFEDLPKLCRRERLFARSLFLDHADVEVEKAGPWLVGLGQAPDALDRVLNMVGRESAAVYWCCPAGEAVLHRHLRTLNMARIPAWAAAGGTAPPADGSGQEPTPVMFRHWDPRVLGALMPVLDGTQFARVLGPVAEIAFLAVDYGGVRRVVADPAFPPTPSGLLTIRSDQVAALNGRRVLASERRIMTYLREVAPHHTRSTTDGDLAYQVRYSTSVGRDLGIVSERGLAQWTFMMVVSEGRVANQKPVLDFICEPGQSPDRRVDEAMARTVAAARARDGAS